MRHPVVHWNVPVFPFPKYHVVVLDGISKPDKRNYYLYVTILLEIGKFQIVQQSAKHTNSTKTLLF